VLEIVRFMSFPVHPALGFEAFGFFPHPLF
jgi:hypothetical protein